MISRGVSLRPCLSEPPLVLKVGGNDLDRSGFLEELADLVGCVKRPLVLVHGGGRGTSQLAERLGLVPRFLEGLRVTDDAALEVAVQGLVGQSSTQVVRALVAAGVPALGLSGVDASLVEVEKLTIASGDLGHVGRPVAVNAPALRALLAAGFVPCVSPICVSHESELYNVNADSVAQAIAVALQAPALLYVTNVPGVRLADTVVPRLTVSQVAGEIDSGRITGGMIPKVRAACEAVSSGVACVLISDLAGGRSWLEARGGGTEIVEDFPNAG